jgi:transcriptional regulator with GAF, ATPase, and Fis domain
MGGNDGARNRERLRHPAKFEQLLTALSTRFINVPGDRVDSEIDAALRQVRQFFGTDRCGILEIREKDRFARVVHASYAEGVERVSGDINLAALFPWAYDRLIKHGGIACFERPDQLPHEAKDDLKSHVEMGIRSWLAIPLKVGGRVTHVITINTVREERAWDRGHIPRLRLVGEILLNGLERKRKEMELKELRQQLERENDYLREEAKISTEYEDIVGRSDALKRVLVQAEQVARTGSTVLIMGETGTGKELIAKCIHRLSRQKERVMVKVNCASLPAALVESELFGREKGAYTGALSRQIGRFEIANGSTIFLDEVTELPLELQAKLLRVLQDGEFERLGGPQTIRVNVRVIAATNRDLAEAVHSGAFREDLYYRLNVFPIHVPPLRERAEDIPMLVTAFLNEFSLKMGKKIKWADRKTMDDLQRYKWPGNIRELRNVIEQAVIISTGDKLRVNVPRSAASRHPTGRNLKEVQYRHIIDVLETTGWRIKGPGGAAEVLGVRPSTLYTKMESLKIPTRRERVGIVT